MYHCISQHLASTWSSVLWGRNSIGTCIHLHRSNNHNLANNEIVLHGKCRCHRVYGPAQFSVRRTVFPKGIRSPPRTQLPREYGPSKILYIQGIQSGGGGGLNSLIEWRFDLTTQFIACIIKKRRNRFSSKSQPL